MTDLAAQLTQLETAQLVRRVGEEQAMYIFKHALTQDAAYQSLLHTQRKEIHRRVAQAYQAQFGDQCLDEYAGILANHYAQAGDDEHALVYARHAGDLAAIKYAHTEAIAFYTQAIDAAKRIGGTTEQFTYLYTRRGRIYETMGHDPIALSTYQELNEFAHARGDHALELESFLLQAKLHSIPSVTFDRAQAIALLAQAEELANTLGNRQALAQIRWTQTVMHQYSGESDEAIRCGEQAMALAREVGARELLGYILGDLARAVLARGQMDRIATLEQEAQTIWRELGNKPMLADNLMQTATRSLLQGDYDQALALTDEGIALSRTIDSKLSLLSNMGTQIYPYLERGEFECALNVANEILTVTEKLKLAFNGPLAYTNVAWMYGILGAYDRGEKIAQTARAILNQPDLPEFFRRWGAVMLANFYLEWGKLDIAEQTIALSQIENEQYFGGPASIHGIVVLGNYYYARGEFKRAAELMEQRINLIKPFGVRSFLHGALFIRAKAVRALGDSEQAYELAKQARSVAASVQSRRMLWQIDALLSAWERERGNLIAAENYLAQACENLAFIIAHTPLELRESFSSLMQVRAVMETQ